MKIKRVIALLAVLSLMICGFSVNGYAANTDNVFYYDNNVEIEIDGDNIGAEKMQQIADYVATGDETDGVEPCGIFCIFGHDLVTSYAKETTHYAYSTDPKCLIKKYTVQYCDRSTCDYITKELTSSYRTAACH